VNVEQFLAWRLRSLLALFAGLRGAGKERGRVLFLLTGGIGDKLMALPAIRQFRQEFPSKPLTLIVMGIAPPFFAGEADHLIQLGMDDTAGLLREARRGFDACFVNSVGIFEVRLELAAFLSGARDLRGPKFPGTGRSLYSRPYDFGVGHETAINLRGAGGTPSEDRVPYLLTIPPDAKSEKVPDVIFHPGSSAKGLTNRWPAENYAETARQLRAAGLSVLAIGTPGEKDLLGNLQNLAGEALTTRADLSLEQLAIYLSRARLVIANDSGIGHLAAAVGAPLLTIIGSSRPEKIAPVGSRVTVIGPRCEYGGCYNNPNVPECKMCIARITPDEVVHTALTKLAA
jgi:ADP-heptose:LPS heptosyltransferase